MAGIRAGFVAFAMAFAWAPAAAWACEEPPKRDERPRVAGAAGDTVEIEIPNTLQGARYAIWLVRGEARSEDDDDRLAKGEDEDAEKGVEADFEVPDLGEDERVVRLLVEVAHEADEADWAYRVDLDYRGRPAAEAPEDRDPAPEPQPQPDPEPEPKPDERPPPPPAPDRSSDAQPAPAPAAAKPPPPPPPPAPATPAPAVPVERAAPAPPPAAPALPLEKAPAPVVDLLDGISAVGTAIPDVVETAAAPRRAGEQRPRRRSRPARERTEPQALPQAERKRPAAEPAEEGGIRLPEVDLPGFGSGLAWSLIGGGGLAFALAGLGVAGLGRHRRRRSLSSPV